jgi:hypothetical protein
MAIVYEHLRNDTNEVFYVGIGREEKRAFSKDMRNRHWKHITNKVDYTVNILVSDTPWEDACKIERLLIEKYGRRDLGLGTLVNMTDGGEGVLGVVVSEETRQKLREINTGKTHLEETKKKIGEKSKGRVWKEESSQKLSEVRKGDKNPMFGKPGVNIGKKFTEQTRQKMSEANKGDKNSMFGKKHSEEIRQKMREVKKGKTCSEEVKQKISLGNRNKKGVKGYYFNKASKTFNAKIKVRGKTIYLGSFDTPEEASEAYQKARLIYFA